MRKPWGIECPPQLDARFHFIAEGTAWLRGLAFGRIRLRAGDVALLPRGIRHVLADSPRRRAKLLRTYPFEATGDTTYRLTAGGRGARTLVVCCSVGFGAPAAHPLLELMPPVLIVRGGATKDSALPTLLDIMAGEVAAPRIGTATIMARLADVIIARLLRAWVDSRRGDTAGWLAAVRDPRIGRALVAVHRTPGRQWSVDALAEVAGTSRTLFAERFAALVGVPTGPVPWAVADAPGQHLAAKGSTDRERGGRTCRLRIRRLVQPCVQTHRGGAAKHAAPAWHLVSGRMRTMFTGLRSRL